MGTGKLWQMEGSADKEVVDEPEITVHIFTSQHSCTCGHLSHTLQSEVPAAHIAEPSVSLPPRDQLPWEPDVQQDGQ